MHSDARDSGADRHLTAPVRITRPTGRATPLLYDSPHSGRYYPADFDTKATRSELRLAEDAYVDGLLSDTPDCGVYLLEANYSRCYIDVNREETDIDPGLLSERWPADIAPTEKSTRGLGLIRRWIIPGVEVNARSLSVAEVRSRIETVYRPYRDALVSLVEEIRSTHGLVWHINWHSMKAFGNAMTPDGPGAARPDFVVSDRNGRSASQAFRLLVVDRLRRLGYVVALNDPYVGGSIIERTGNPARDIHSVQIEINRRLYLDELRVEKNEGFTELKANLTSFTRELAQLTRAER